MYAKHNFAPRILIGCLTAAITLLASAPLTRADDEPNAEQKYAKLQRDLLAAYQAKDYEKALDLAEKCHKIKPKEVDTIYNIACIHSLLDHKDKAYEWLDKAIEAGYDDADHLAQDADFKNIKGEKRFRAIVKQLRDGDEEDDDADEAETKPDDDEADADADKDSDDADEAGDDDEKDSADDEDDEDDEDAAVSPQAAQAKINELTQKMMKASEHKKYKEALEMAEEALKIAEKADVAPLKSLTNYNVACMHSLMKEKDKAFKHLEAAIELGGFGQGNIVQQIEDDADFDNIRKDPRYKKLLAKAGGKKSGQGRRSAGRQSPFKWEVHVPENLNTSKPAPLIVALHGYNANLEDAMETWKEAADKVGAILLVPQGTMKLEGDHYHWGRDLDTIEENVMDAIDKVMDKHKVAKDKVALVGFSQGAWASWNLATRNPDTFCGLIPVAGNFEPESESIFDDEQLKKLRIFIMVGQDDQENVVAGNRTLAEKFEKLGASVKIKVYDGVAHAFPDEATAEQTKALKFVLGE